MLNQISITLIYCLALSACVNKESESPWMYGIWERVGYGDVYVIEKDNITLYQYTRTSCLQSNNLAPQAFTELLTDIKMQDKGEGFTAILSKSPAFRQNFSRMKLLPVTCLDNSTLITASNTTPTKTFEHLWHTFNDYYAFFNERSVNWPKQYEKFYQHVDDDMSKKVLFELLSNMLSAIDDGHIYLTSDSDEFSPEKIRGSRAILSTNFKNQEKLDPIDDYAAEQSALYREILIDYLDKGSIQQAGGMEGTQLTWGTINQHLGYLFIQSMESIAANPDTSTSENVQAVQAILDQAMSKLGDTQALIIDVRFNGGGHDAISLAIANRFTDQKRLVMTKTTRTYRGETSPRPAYLRPVGHLPYLNPIAVIAGPDSASATEIFLLAMRALPQVIQIGEPSNGILSDELFKLLPNGWEISLSNEVYYDHTGINYEAKGIPPHIQVPVFNLETLKTKRDPALDTAINALKSILIKSQAS